MKSFALNASKKTKSTSVGEIPVDWACVSLESISEVSGGVQKGPHREPNANPVRYLTVAHVQANKILTSDPRYFELSADELERWRLEAGDLLVVEGNGSAEQIGRTALFSGEIPDCVHQNHIIRVRPNATQAAPEYLNVFLNSDVGRQVIGACSFTSSGLRTLSVGRIKTLPIPLPSLAEQRKIAAIFSAWDEGLVKLDALIEAKERRRKALMQRLLTGSLRFPKYGKTPWRKVRMNTVLTRVFRPIEWTADKPLSLVSVRRRCGGLFRRADVLGSGYKTQDLHDLKADDFLISKRQVVHGAWALVTPEFEGSHVSKEYVILVNAAPDKLHMPFFAWLAQSSRMIRLARVASTGVHIEKLIFDPEVFLRDIIRLPATLAEQEQIAETLDACAAEVRLLRQQRTALDRQKRGLMQRLLTGKLRVTL